MSTCVDKPIKVNTDRQRHAYRDRCRHKGRLKDTRDDIEIDAVVRAELRRS